MNFELKKVPQHIAIIMDGNGRWAQLKGLSRIEGHRRGMDRVDDIVAFCRELGIRYLTLYAFSMENWGRPKVEIEALMFLLKEMLVTKREKLSKNEVRLVATGDLERLPPDVLQTLRETEEMTQQFNKLVLNLAFSDYLDTAGIPDPDLVIRTSGEFRLSNFLLWQSAYSELYFTDTPWPDFGREALTAALEEYQRRERRFGRTSEQIHGGD